MNIHDVQVALLCEIDKICKENHIEYILYGECARCACIQHTLMNCGPIIEIAMCQGDAERFAQIVEKEHSVTRYVEGLINNPRFSHEYLTYGNLDTTDFNIRRIDYDKNKGIAIHIHYIAKGAKRRKKQQYLTRAWSLINTKIVNRELWFIKLPLAIVNLFVKIIGEKRLGRLYYKALRKVSAIDTWENIFKYSNVNIAGKTLSTKQLAALGTVSAEGMEWPIPENYQNYFKKIVGADWETKPIGGKMKAGQIVSTVVGFRSLLKDSHIQQAVISACGSREKIEYERVLTLSSVRKANRMWALVLMTQKQLEFQKLLQQQKDYILNLDEDKDKDELYSILKPVISSLVYYSEKHMTYSVGTEFDYKIEAIMLAKGQAKKVEKIRKLRKIEKYV